MIIQFSFNTSIKGRSLVLGLLLLILCACKSGSGDTRSSQSKPIDNSGSQAVVQIKGNTGSAVISNAKVSLFKLKSDLSAGELLGEATTNGLGEFTIDLPVGALGTSVLFVLEAGSQTTMLCHFSEQCLGLSNFGESLSVDFMTLYSSLPTLQAESNYSINVFSHLAYILAQELESGLVTERLEKAHSKVSARFGLFGDAYLLNMDDITNQESLGPLNMVGLEASILNGALIASAGQNEANLFAIIENLSRQFVVDGFPDVAVANSNLVSVANVLENAIAVAQLIPPSEYKQAVISQWSAKLQLIKIQSDNVAKRGEVSQTRNLPPLAQAKALVSDIRQIAASVNFNNIVALSKFSGVISDTLAKLLEDFGFGFELDDLFDNQEFSTIEKALIKLAGVYAEVLQAHFFGGEVPPEVDGIRVDFSDYGDSQLVSIHQLINACELGEPPCFVSVVLDLDVNIDRVLGNEVAQFISLRGVDLKLSGSLSTDNMSINFPGENQSILAKEIELTLNEENSSKATYQITVEDLDLNLPSLVTLEKPGESIQYSLAFDIASALIDLDYITEETAEYFSDRTLKGKSKSFVVYSLIDSYLNARAGISSSSGESFYGGLYAAQTTNIESELIYTDRVKYDCPIGVVDLALCTEIEAISGIEGETENNYLGLSMATSFKANLKGLPDPVVVALSGERAANKEVKIGSIKINSDKSAFVLDAEFNNGGGVNRLNAVNIDGVEMDIDLDERNERYGSVTMPSGEIMANIVDMNDWIKITFIDGYFESM